MNILICVKDMYAFTGISRHVIEQIRYFKQCGHNVFVASERIDIPQSITDAGAKIYKTFRWPVSGYRRRYFYQWQVNRLIKKYKPDLVIGHGDIVNQDVLFMHNCIHLAHELIHCEPLPETDPVGLIHATILEKKHYKLLICNSLIMKDDFIRRFGCDADKIKVLYQDLNPDEFQIDNPEAEYARWREKYGIKSDNFTIGFITSGDFTKRNLSLLMRSFTMLKKVRQKIKLLIAGKDKFIIWKSVAEELGIEKDVVFLPIIKDVKYYYNMIDLFVLPSHIEEFGKSALEAMYCKKPVILTKNVGSAEILEGKSKDFILQELSEEELTQKIEKLISSKNLCTDLGELNRNTSLKYTTDNTMKKFNKLLLDSGIKC